jgi:acyl-coenzyme A thioesterase PaaI-like protein
MFSRIVRWVIPYTGTIRASVRSIAPGRAEVRLDDRRRVRNHLGSVHAVALTNLGEFASGLALVAGLPPRTRAIVTRLETRFLHKARGRLEAEGSAPVAPVPGECERIATARIRDASGQVVCEVDVTWRLRPVDEGGAR